MVARHHRSNTDSGHHTGAKFSLKPPYDADFPLQWPPFACMETGPKSASRQSLDILSGWSSDDEPAGFPEHKEHRERAPRQKEISVMHARAVGQDHAL
jgi:hypothetical protein